MDRDHTFDLPDLTEDFWKTVVFAQKEHPSGMRPGLCMAGQRRRQSILFRF